MKETLLTVRKALLRWFLSVPGRLARLAVGAGLLLGSISAQAQTPISGAFTINSAQPTAGTNFASFTAAAARLNTDGISGPVTFTVSGGPYNEQFLLNQITGSSTTNTIVVNGGGQTISFASANTNQRAVVQLNGTDYTTINNLVIDATGGTYGYGILLTSTADNNRLTNNVITTDPTSTSSTNFAGIVTSGSVTSPTTAGISANNLLIEGNTITGGYYGIDLYGNTTAVPNTGNIIRNNIVRDFYINGIYLGAQEGTIITGNDISRPTRSVVSSFNGIYAFNTARGLAIEKNRIHDPFTGSPTSTSAANCIFIATGTGATATQTNDVVNNVIYNLTGNGVMYGVNNSASTYLRVYNNSISADDQTSTATGATYGINSTGANNDVRNNVISITRTGTGTKYALYYTQATTTSNYNDLYAPTGNVGYYTTAYATLAAWQAANGAAFDQNSLAVDPQYTAPATGNLLPLNTTLNNAGQALTRVTDDITGATRGTVPDPGAYEFTPSSLDLAVVALQAPAAGAACYSATEAVTVQVRNNGGAALNFATNPATVTVVVTPPTGAAQTFTITLNTSTLASGATQSVTLPGTLNMTALGTYSFAVTATVVGDLNTANNVLTPAPTRTVLAPVAGVLSPASVALCVSGTATLTVASAANGSIQFQSSSSATGPFTDIAGATSTTFTTPVLTSTTYYRVRTTCTTTVFSNVTAITVNNPVITAAPTPLSTCAGGTATLTATVPTGVSVRYFTAATGGTLVGTGSPYVTGPLTTNTTFYAEAFSGGGAERVGPLTNTIGTGGGANLTYALIFDVTSPTVLTGVYVYPTAAGVSNIQLLNSAGTVLLTYAATFTAADLNVKTFVPLNFNLPAGTGLRLAHTSVGSTASLYRNTTGASYPYTSPSGTVSITGNSFSGFPQYYYYFYDWVLGSECTGATRTPIVVNVTSGLVASLPVAAFTSCGQTPYQLAGTIAGSATGAVYTSSGTGTFAPTATTLNATYTPSAADVAAGTVTLTLTPTGPTAPCTSTGRVVLTLQTPPNASFSYPAGIYCTGSAATVAPVLATGATAGTFSTTGVGLRIDAVTGVITLAATTGTGPYTIVNTVAGTGVCTSFTSSTTITILQGVARPTLTATTQPNGSVLLTAPAIAGASYQFFLGPNNVGPASTSNTLLLTSAAQSGSYTVVVTGTSGCTSTPSATVVVTVVTGTVSSRNGVSLRVYPNPTANGQLTVELLGLTASASPLTVLNGLGQVVHSGTAAAGAGRLDLSALAAGVYTVRVLTAEGVLTQRLVRQ